MRSVLVTGGGRGIGRAIAIALAAPDMLVIVASRTPAELDRTAAEVRSRGAEALPVVMDVADPESVTVGFSTAARHTSAIDVLVNNAGVGGGERVEGSNITGWKRILDTNLLGTYLVCRSAIPMMREGGRIVNLSSVLGRFGVAGYTAYCASKHGVIGLTRALALELAGRDITVNAICPGWVDTEMARQGMEAGAHGLGVDVERFRAKALSGVPIKRIIQPEEVAELVKFLASPAAAAITGQTYNICGGQSMD
ncbi:MAG: SDR family oxidoreductase [Acidobacteria bacterium]|nr:SDR family oxidoreductase [Acidobacteriota bacterium]